MKRTKKLTKSAQCANPLFEQWLEEWRMEALARDSPLVHSFRKALASLRKYPLPLATGKDCIILQYFGNKLCSMIDKKLEQYKKINKLPTNLTSSLPYFEDEIEGKRPKVSPMKEQSTKLNTSSSEKESIEAFIVSDDDNDHCNDVFNIEGTKATNTVEDNEEKPRKKSTKSTSSEEDFKQFCTENAEPTINVKKSQQHFVFTEVTDSLPNTLIGSNKRNENTIDKAQIQCSTQNRKPNDTKKAKAKGSNQKKKISETDDTSYESFFLLPNNFDVVLLVDTQETSGGKTKPQDDQTLLELSETGILFEIRSLKIGDFTWIARCRFTNKELVLPYIVERKRIDDLSASIVDGRYKEQKFRLKQSGIKNVVYMIENYGKNYYGSIPLSSLLQASVNSLIQDNFIVKFTSDHRDSMRYLATMTNMIAKIYESKELTSCRKKDLETEELNVIKNMNIPLMEFNEFNKAAKKTKNFKVREMFMRQLLQLKGISVEKAIAITNLYPTPRLLTNAFKVGDENLLAKISFGSSSMKIGPAISKTLYHFYTKYNFN